MPRTLTYLLVFASLAVAASVPAHSASTSANLSIGVAQSQTITAVSLSKTSFTGGAPAGTVVGAISVTMSPAAPPFSGTLSLGGTNASSFHIVSANLETSGTVAAGTYQVSLVAIQSGATGSPFTQAETITATAPAASTCPRGTAYPADGCTGAQATGSVQRPTFFTGYTGMNYGANRPPWNVAGVDYPVGYNPTTTFLDPSVSGNLPACATYAGNNVRINSAPCTIQNFDFSLHNGICLTSSSGINNGQTITVMNNKFAWGTNCNGVSMVSFAGTINLLFEYNELDGSLTANYEEIFRFYTTGATIVEYNALFNADEHVLHGASTNVTTKYNYVETIGYGSAHGDYIYPDGNLNWDNEYDTVYQTTAGCCTTALCYLASGEDTFGTAICSNNVLVSRPSGSYDPVSRLIDVGYPTEPPDTIENLYIQNNYLDPSGASDGWLVNEGGITIIKAATCNHNISMITGASFAGTFGSGANLFTCS